MYRVLLSLALATPLIAATPAVAAETPQIRLSATNQVPLCVTPERLMKYLKKRNPNLLPAFGQIAHYYQKHGEAIGVRWDFAFYQMIVETNWLKYRTGSGRMGDVHPTQNNFAGLGATGGGVPGERFPDVSSGVLAHLQHIKMYSGERIADPVAKRTRKVQDWLIDDWASKFNRPLTFTDLTKKWSPNDSGYSNDIASVANRYYASHCPEGPEARREQVASADTGATASSDSSANAEARASGNTGEQNNTTTATRTTGDTRVASASAMPIGPLCRVWTAEYSGAQKAVLIRSADATTVNYTALAVRSDLLDPQTEAFIAQHAKGGQAIGQFDNTGAALNKAFELCPQN